jgi:hypothetical protein
LKSWIPIGGIPKYVEEVLGSPLHISKLANGGDAWTYIKSDADKKQFKSWSVVFDKDSKVTGVFSKPM